VNRSLSTAGAAMACTLALWTHAAQKNLPLPEMVVAKTVKAPTIDGKLEPGEWDRAPAATAFVTAFQGDLCKIQSVVWVTYDDQFLYIAFKNYRGPTYTLLSKRARENDDEAIVFDHSNEIWITPPVSPATTYQTLFNSYPGVFDKKVIPSVGYVAMSWQGGWVFASSETKDYWIVEAKAPIKSFGFETIEEGSAWRGLFTTDVLGAGGFRAWSPGGAFIDIPRHGLLHFNGLDTPIFQFLDSESIFTGKFSFPMAVTMHSVKAAHNITVTVRCGAGIEPAQGDLVLNKTVHLEGGEKIKEEFTIAGDLTTLDLPKEKIVVQDKPRVEKECPHGFCEITAKTDRGVVLYHQVFPFVIDGFVRTPPAEIKKTPYETPFGLSAFYAPLNKKLIVKVDRLYTERRAEAVAGVARLLDPTTKKAIAERPIAPFYRDYSQFPMDLATLDVPIQTEEDWAKAQPVAEENRKIAEQNKKLKAEGKPELPLREVPGPKPAEYSLEVALATKDGQQIATTAVPVGLMGYQFEWLPNNVGISDKAIPPWTPLKWDGGRLSMWNKTYRLNGLGLAEEIVNGGRRQLSGRMRLLARVGGKEIDVAKGTSPTLESLTEAAAELTGAATLNKIAIEVKTRVEFDGFVLNTMTVTPRRPDRLDGLSLLIRMPKAEAPFFVTTAGGWSAYHGPTPERWDSRETSSGSRVGNFVPYVFLTDSERGFCWFADTDRGWLLDHATPTLELTHEGKDAVLRVNFVTKPGELAAPLTIQYGWMATPQKPRPREWRAYHIDHHKPYPKAHCVFYCDADWAVLWPYYCSPYPWDYEKSKKALEGGIKAGITPCVGNIAHAIARYRDHKNRWFNELGADWGETLGDLSNGNVARGRGPNDFQLWHFDRWVKLSGLPGLYFDENYLGEDRNYLTGGAWLMPDERIQPGYNYLGLREYDKRLRTMFHGNGKPPPNLWLHTTSGQPVYAWMPDVAMEGENVEPASMEDDYMTCLPASRLRSIGMGANLGAAALIMCQADRHWNDACSAFMVQQFVGWVLAHDCLPESNLFWPVLASELELWHDDTRFLPYWKPGTGVESRTKDIAVSAHARPGRAALWIVNTSREDRKATIKINLGKLGLHSRRTVAFDAETGERYPLSRGFLAGSHTLTVGVPKRFWRAVRLMDPKEIGIPSSLSLRERAGVRDPGTRGAPVGGPSLARVAFSGQVTFLARFDGDEVAAEEAFGHRYPRTQGPEVPRTVPGGKTGRAASLDEALVFDTRHHVAAEQGAISFALRLPDANASGSPLPAMGALVSFDGNALQLRLDRGKLSLLGAKGAALGEAAVKADSAWHEVGLSWKGNDIVVAFDGAQAFAAKLDAPLPIRPMARGLGIQDYRQHITPSRLALGPVKGALLDDLLMMR